MSMLTEAQNFMRTYQLAKRANYERFCVVRSKYITGELDAKQTEDELGRIIDEELERVGLNVVA